MSIPNVMIVLARCSKHGKEYGIRFEEIAKQHWVGDWAFDIKKAMARKEGYDKGEMRGRFDFSPEYPGCPHCRATSVFLCVCGRVACWDGETRQVRCVWCGQILELGGQVESLRAGRDR